MRIAYALAALPLLASPALAQDWGGAYVGAHLGGNWGNVAARQDPADWGPNPPAPEYDTSGAFIGVTAGYNWLASDMVVLGLEGNVGLASFDGSAVIPSDSGYQQNLYLGNGLLGDVSGRLGLSMGNVLVYGKAGIAFFTGEAVQATTKSWYTVDPASGFVGWTAGFGVETMVSETISIKAEYQHYDLGEREGTQTKTSEAPLGVDDSGTFLGHVFKNWQTVGTNVVRVGINFHF